VRVDALALALRPRPMLEAADLGVRLVQARARSVWASVMPVHLAVVALALTTIGIAGWLPGLVIFWLKPWLDRSLLFVLSRAVFAEDTTFIDLWRAQRTVWWRQWASTLTWRRLSPWRAFTQPVYQLEGQRWRAGMRRRSQVLAGRRGVATAMHLAFAHIELIFVTGLFALAMWFMPQGQLSGAWSLLRGDSLGVSLASTLAYAAVVLVLEPFYVAAGFAMYLNRRVELEAWDIEQEFRRAFAA